MDNWALHINGIVAEGDHDAPQLLDGFVDQLKQHSIPIDNFHAYRGVEGEDEIGFFVQGTGDVNNVRTYLTEFVAELRSKGLQIKDAVVMTGEVRNDLGLAAGTQHEGAH